MERWAAMLGVRPKEGRRTALLFLTLMLLIAGYTTTKAVRDAVFLSRFSIASLSWLMIASAAVAAVGIALFNRYAARRARDQLIFEVNVVIALSLSAIAVGLRVGGGAWLAWGLALWSSVFGLFLVAEFWLLANDLLNARQARRLYGLIGAGAIVGGILGGAISGWGSRRFGAVNLLHVVSLLLIIAAVAARAAARGPASERGKRAPERGEPLERGADRDVDLVAGFRSLGFFGVRSSTVKSKAKPKSVSPGRHRLVRALAGLTVCATLCITLAQWQWKGIVRAHFDGHPDDMAAFFGYFAAALNTVSLLVQLLLTTRLLRRWGTTVGIAVLPVGMALGMIALIAGALTGHSLLITAGVAAMMSDSLRFSVDKAATELLYQPLPREAKETAKPFVDTVVDRLAGGLAGLLWIAMVKIGGIDQPAHLAYASIPILAIVVVWGALLVRARRAYLDELAHTVGRAPSSLVADARSREALARGLSDVDARVRRVAGELSALDARRALEPTELDAMLSRIEWHVQARRNLRDTTTPSPMGLLAQVLDEALKRDLEELSRMLAARYPEETAVSVRCLCDRSTGRRAAALELLDHLIDAEHRSLVLRLEAAFLDELSERRLSRRATLALLLEDPDPWLRAVAVHTALGEPGLTSVVRQHTQDRDPWVREAAWRGISAVDAEASAC